MELPSRQPPIISHSSSCPEHCERDLLGALGEAEQEARRAAEELGHFLKDVAGEAFYELGVDGLFSDFPDTAFAARAMFLLKNDPDYAKCLLNQRRCARADD